MKKAALSLIVLLSACATAPDPAELAAAASEPAPEREAGIAMIESAIRAQLKDPDSAQFTWPNSFVHGWYQPPFGRRYIGWITCGTVNARNSFGGYVGRTAVVGVIRNGSVIAANMDSSTHRDMPFVAAACQKIGVPVN